MTKIDKQQVIEELKSLGNAPFLTGSPFDRAAIGEVLKEESAPELRILKAFELGRRSMVRLGCGEGEGSLENIGDVALELDGEVNAIGIQAELIADVRVTLGGLHQDMNNVDMDNLKYYFEDFHRKVRMLDSLLIHASKGLSDHHENVKYLKDVLNNMTVNGQ